MGEKSHTFICCFCGKKVIGWGNDPWPLKTGKMEECCDECDMSMVVPARLKQLEEHQR